MKYFSSLPFLKITLGAGFFAVLVYCFQVAYTNRYQVEGDATDYLSLGISLAEFQKYGPVNFPENGGLIKAFREGDFSKKELNFGGHSTWRPPIWPMLIAGVFMTFGYNLIYLLIFKFLLHLIATFVFYRTLKLFKICEVIIILGVFLYGISPAWQLYSRVFLSEPVTLFFITLWIYLLARFIQKKSGPLPQALLAGIFILSHPYYLFLPFSVYLILSLKKEMKFKFFIISSLVCFSVVSLWIIRNFIVLDANEPVLTTSSGAVMAKGWNSKVVDEHTNTQGDLADEGLVLKNYQNKVRMPNNEVERMQLYKDATLHYIRKHPEQIIPIVSTKLKSAFYPFPETPRPGILETGRWLFHLFALLALIYILILTKNRFLISLALGIILSTIGITVLTYSGFRFRMPQVGLELLLIIYAVDDLVKRKRSRATTITAE